MNYATFDVEINISRTVRVRFPVDDPAVVGPDEDVEDVAEEIALGGKVSWPEFVISEDEDVEMESIVRLPNEDTP